MSKFKQYLGYNKATNNVDYHKACQRLNINKFLRRYESETIDSVLTFQSNVELDDSSDNHTTWTLANQY